MSTYANMWISIVLTPVVIVMTLLYRLIPRLRHNKAKAEKTGLPVFWTRKFKKYFPCPRLQLTPSAWPIYGPFELLNDLFLRVANQIPFLSKLSWIR